MKGLLLFVVVYTNIHPGLSRTLSLTSDHCQPCGPPSMDGLLQPHNRSPGYICTIANEFTIKIDILRRTVRNQLNTLVSDVFDGDASYLEWRYQQRRHFLLCAPSDSSRLSPMTSLYDRLVGLHIYVNFTEGYQQSCSVTIEGIAHRVSLALCDLHLMMRVTSQTQGHDDVCRKQCCLATGGCVSFQRHAYNALRYASDVLESICQEAGLLKQGWGC
ncbi:uncharacterized protein LOC125378361 isoform X1 [Haliotis rufescens]|uniref:uncharacterized protein LOC125378361 isoform X1 n=2 Tax=Haliotis rufescens TaxID=6454 RepID=UPI00201EA3B3|nr:uncharacterized protein LOC125378361 isoform X1 [Haliotis rufescens]